MTLGKIMHEMGVGDAKDDNRSASSQQPVLVLEQCLELFKDELAEPCLQFAEFLRSSSLAEIVEAAGIPSNRPNDQDLEKVDNEGDLRQWKELTEKVEYLRNVVHIIKLFSHEIVGVISKLLHNCVTLMVGAFDIHNWVCREQTEINPTNSSNVDRKTLRYSERILRPVISLVYDCLEINAARMEHSILRMLQESLRFLSSPAGISLGRPDFLRVLALCQRLQKLISNSGSEWNIDNVEFMNSLTGGNIMGVLSTENGRTLVKFCCEISSSQGDIHQHGKHLPPFLKSISISGVTTLPEIYMVFTTYLEDPWFWGTDVGKSLTPILIATIRHDLGTSDKTKTGSKKRAAFVLKAITENYSSGKPLFDPTIPEVDIISLENTKDMKMYKKFWTSFFDIFDILNETQVHIVQPVLKKLTVFQEYSNNPSILMWLPILLTKAIRHDNRTIVKEGLDRFLQTGGHLQTGGNSRYRQVAKGFLDEHVIPLIKEHVGWVLSEPEEFFKTVRSFGNFLTDLHSDSKLANFLVAEKILSFLTESGKCMSPHAIYFLISALDEAMNPRLPDIDNIMKQTSSDDHLVMEHVNKCMELLANLLCNNVTTVSKYFRDILESHGVNVLFKITHHLTAFPNISLDSPTFSKLLTVLASLSWKTVYKNQEAHEKLKSIMKSYNLKGELAKTLISAHLYNFVQSKLSASSVLGTFRFLILTTLGDQESDSYSKEIELSIVEFADQNLHNLTGIVKGSLEGLYEFHQNIHLEIVPNTYFKMMEGVMEKVGSAHEKSLSPDDFAFCLRAIEIINSGPLGASDNVVIPEFDALTRTRIQRDPLRIFIIGKMIADIGHKESEFVDTLVLNSFEADGGDRFCEDIDSCEGISKIGANYFQAFDRNLFAEFHRLKFQIYRILFKTRRLGDQFPLRTIASVLNTIEKCDPKGVATALALVKSIAWTNTYMEDSKIANKLEELASVGWSLVFENRKNEAFWKGYQAWVDFIICPHFLQSGTLNKFADLIFNHGETIPGLSFVFVQGLVKVDFPHEMLHESHKLLLKAALAGSPVPKNNRVSFAIWDYLRRDVRYGSEDPEHFSSDCRARILATEKIRLELARLLSTDEHKSLGEELLRLHTLSLLERNDGESKNNKRYFGGSLTHRIKQRTFQVLLILQPHFNIELSELTLDNLLKSISSDSPQPSVRYMGEWVITLIIERYPELHKKLLDSLDECIQNRVGYGAYFSTICLQISKQLKSPEFFDKVLQALTTLTLSQHLTVRIYAQVAFQKIYERAQHSHFQSVIDKYAPVLAALLGALAYVSGNCSKLLDNISQDFYVNVFDGRRHYCHEVIFSLLPSISGMVKDECVLLPETIRQLVQGPLTNDSCSTLELEELYFKYEKSAWHLKTVVADGRELGEEIPNVNAPTKLSPAATNALNNSLSQDGMNYQKKINPWKLLSVSEEIEDYSELAIKNKCVSEDGLVVVGSLLEHLPNLGGLCRTSEIFGVNKYVVSSLKVINDQHFQSLSVSSQNWLNILEVPIRDLKSFLQTYSAKGYTILGVEQANESSSLIDFVFPKKAVLLLGNEKQGIPTELLHLVDKCIEIPQVGIIRSLNVHVTGALCIWQYASQHSLR